MPLCTCTDAGSITVAEDPACTRPGTARLVPIDTEPVVGETPLVALRSWLTPTPLFYVRNHYFVPEIDPTDWSLSITGAVSNPADIPYSDLLRLPKTTLPAMLECAGNNHSDLGPDIPGNPFEDGAISNAIWAGAPLKPFLQQTGISPDAVEVLFEGADSGPPAPGGGRVAFSTTGTGLHTVTPTTPEPLEVVTSYRTADLANLSFAQSADVLYIVHEDRTFLLQVFDYVGVMDDLVANVDWRAETL